MKSVCVVGAGPSGLVSAKTFKQHGYTVSVYEAADRIGGMWRAEQGEWGDKCRPDMRTNLSRFTVAFPDLSWESVDLTDPVSGLSPKEPPIFPKAWQVGRYLARYADVFGIRENIFLQKRVVKAWHEDDNSTWRVETEDVLGTTSIDTFDILIVASGFFDKPAKSFCPSAAQHSSNIQHSSQFRDLSSIVSSPGKVVVIGGGISGSEAAAQAAFQISNAKHSPNKTRSAYVESKIYHIINRPFYCLPRYLP
jgi:cation diffusion facilitator CzcD-associated flavoprotein CzcO